MLYPESRISRSPKSLKTICGGLGDIDGDGIPDSEDEEPRIADDKPNYSSMTVAELKKVLKKKGLSVSGKKADLISRLEK